MLEGGPAFDPFPAGIALHARSLVLRHPDTGEQVRFLAPIPVEWSRRFASLDLPR